MGSNTIDCSCVCRHGCGSSSVYNTGGSSVGGGN